MNINKNTNFGTHNTSARPGDIKYLVFHYVGATGDAKNNIDYYNNKSTTNASADFFVGHNGDVWQYNPDPLKRYCWSVGGKKQSSYGGTLYGIATNANCISVEMCVKTRGSKSANSPDWYFTEATIDSSVELGKYLMDSYNIPIENVIRHFDVNGKMCPGVVGWNSASGSESAWNDFKARLVQKETAPVGEWYRVRKSWEDAKSQLGAFSVLDNAKKLADKNPGYEVYDSNGKCVYAPGSKATVTPVKKSVEDIAREVIDGKWGNGADRKKAITNAGYNYDEVQAKVNELLSGKKTTNKKSVTEIAKEVIAGKWGVGADRKKRLTQAGYDYSKVQAEVNRLLK